MKRKLLRFICASLFTVAGMSVNAQTSGSCGTTGHEDEVTWELNGSQLIFSGTGEIKTYSTDMPTAYPWYAYENDIQSVIIGEGITNIPAWAFAMYKNLVSIHLPSTLKTIGWSCLEETALWNVSLPEGLETIEAYAFMMTPFSTVSIPSTVTEIGERAFGYCESLVSVGCYADEPPTLGNNAFADSPIETVYVKSANISTYKGTAGWEDFGDKIQSPAGYCGPDGSDDDSDDDVTKASWSFDMNTRTLTIEGTKMGQYNRPWESAAMGGQGGGFNPDNNVGYPCGIEHIVIGEGIAAIPPMSFYMEVGIKSVTLPSTLTAIGMNAFGECFNIKTITCDATTPPSLATEVDPDWGLVNPETYVIFGTVDEDTGEPNPIETITAIYVPSESVDDYKAAAGWSTYASKIKGGLVALADNADNSAAISSINGQTKTIVLSGRTLKGGRWNTLCLPFDLMAGQIAAGPLAGATIRGLAAYENDGSTVTVTFENVTAMVAGTPYIVYPQADIVNPVFEDVTISNSLLSVTKGDASFIGTISPVTLYDGAKTNLFLSNNMLYYPSGADVTVGPFRAYFTLSSPVPALAKVMIDFGDDDIEVTGIMVVDSGQLTVDSWYTMSGVRLQDKPTEKGIYIVNGKKVAIK